MGQCQESLGQCASAEVSHRQELSLRRKVLGPEHPSTLTSMSNLALALSAPTQRTSNQTQGFPRLSAWPDAYLAMKYLENGHVTLPQNTFRKPIGGESVFVFGTSQPLENELLVDVLE